MKTDENGLAAPELYDVYRKRCESAIAAIESKTMTEAEKNSTLKGIIRKAVFDKESRNVLIFYH